MSIALVVEDHAPMRKIIATILEDMGHKVCQAANGLEAMRVQLSTPVDFMVTDLFMPDIEGLETIQKTRKLYPNVPIIAVSGGSTHMFPEDYLMMARRFGAQQTLQKPFTVQQVVDAVTAVGFGTEAGSRPPSA